MSVLVYSSLCVHFLSRTDSTLSIWLILLIEVAIGLNNRLVLSRVFESTNQMEQLYIVCCLGFVMTIRLIRHHEIQHYTKYAPGPRTCSSQVFNIEVRLQPASQLHLLLLPRASLASATRLGCPRKGWLNGLTCKVWHKHKMLHG